MLNKYSHADKNVGWQKKQLKNLHFDFLERDQIVVKSIKMNKKNFSVLAPSAFTPPFTNYILLHSKLLCKK